MTLKEKKDHIRLNWTQKCFIKYVLIKEKERLDKQTPKKGFLGDPL